ncbi:MAG: hypothetical protein QOG34_2226 [Frankiaceae bacterium]|jgi:hypothetical protein|nr:hypothetical protein [Frankiaceae bacterium]
MPPRRPTQIEWAQLTNWFPNLVANNVWITDNQTPVYNCIAYSLGVLNAWINPPQPLGPFQALYNGPPYNHPTVVANAPNATIDGWATPQVGPVITTMTHGSRTSTSQPPPLWESKLGSSWRITHGRGELTGATYGRVVTSFT